MNFLDFWQYTDLITKLLFFILIALSVGSWIIGILRFLSTKVLANKVDEIIKLKAETMRLEGLTPSEKKEYAEQAMLKEINKLTIEFEKGVALLGTTAAIAPFIGLFGTVWGIFHALTAIGESGQAGLGQVAGPVGEALIMTGIGLAVAIPAVIFYNICVRTNRKTIQTAYNTAHDVIMQQYETQSKP